MEEELKAIGIPEDPRAVLRRYDIRPKKSWGQNFLVNLALVDRIAEEVARQSAEQVIEIGAGLGTLTSAIAARVPRILAIERDRQLVAILREEFSAGPGAQHVETSQAEQTAENVQNAENVQRCLGERVEIIEADAQTFDYRKAIDRPTVVVGNLPYHLTGRLLRRIIEIREALTCSVVMVQLEVARRLIAEPGTKSYGILSVMCQGWFEPKILWRVSPGSFHPKPKVGSAVVRLDPMAPPRAGDLLEEELSRVVTAAFSSRRKTLRNTLGAAFSKEEALAAMEAEKIDPGLRAEALSVEQLAALTRRLVRQGR